MSLFLLRGTLPVRGPGRHLGESERLREPYSLARAVDCDARDALLFGLPVTVQLPAAGFPAFSAGALLRAIPK